MKLQLLGALVFLLVLTAAGEATDGGNEYFHLDSQTPRCYGIVAAVGYERSTIEKATRDAWDAWVDRVRFDYGALYTHFEQAEDRHSACTMSSTTAILKQAFFRCKISAKPCRHPPEAFDLSGVAVD